MNGMGVWSKPFHIFDDTAGYHFTHIFVSSFLIYGCYKLKHSYKLLYFSVAVPLGQAASLMIVCSLEVFMLSLIF